MDKVELRPDGMRRFVVLRLARGDLMANGTVGTETHIDWERAYQRFGDKLRQYEELLQALEYQHGIQLTPGAVEVFFVPIIETLDSDSELDEGETTETLRRVMQTVKDDPDERDNIMGRRSSWSVIKGYWKNWCDIPPICRATKK
jgi:hypothetical protein